MAPGQTVPGQIGDQPLGTNLPIPPPCPTLDLFPNALAGRTRIEKPPDEHNKISYLMYCFSRCRCGDLPAGTRPSGPDRWDLTRHDECAYHIRLVGFPTGDCGWHGAGLMELGIGVVHLLDAARFES